MQVRQFSVDFFDPQVSAIERRAMLRTLSSVERKTIERKNAAFEKAGEDSERPSFFVGVNFASAEWSNGSDYSLMLALSQRLAAAALHRAGFAIAASQPAISYGRRGSGE
jgi:hypothetical protein